jgi:hypothetical protein
MPRRIVIVGEPAEAGLRNSLIAAFRNNGCDVDALDLGQCKPAWLAPAMFRCPGLAARFRRAFTQRVDQLAGCHPADLTLVVKGPLLDSSSVDYLRNRLGSPVACWNPDSPFDGALSNCGAGIPETVSAYDYYITWAQDIADRLRAAARRVIVIPFAWDPALMPPSPGQGIAADRIVFIGTATRERVSCLRSLARMRPMVFGTGWPQLEGVDIRPPVRGIAFSQIAGEARWNLNLLRPQNARSHNMRTFELVGAGGTQVAPLTDDHRRFLESDGQTALFSSREELESILGSHPRERPPRPPDVLVGHTYTDRIHQLLNDVYDKICRDRTWN